ncbi:protein kinase domain-containing protein [Actinoplanes sp. CA-142083]|uniref:serine/threonine-protein kinase n=1 Tax=Actinoplanes sp. CA-142083 TaxID=3239903 RepID=UPI003D91C4C5
MTTVKRVLGGRYQLEHLLASGGMGTVWQARDQRLNRAVAVKELSGAGLTLPLAGQRFDREARAAARLAHPNIVALHDAGIDDGHPYLVMELIHGRSVAAVLENGPLPPASAVAVAAQTCDGLAAAHAAGIVHRDIKPANLLITASGVVKICDFGIARLHDTANDVTLNGVTPLLGSYKYLAPEQAVGSAVDARTDIYALGCTLYAMVAGVPPFTGDPQTVLQQHLTQPPPSLAIGRDDVPGELEALVRRLLQKDPEQRPTSALEVKSQLAAVSQHLAVTEIPLQAVPTSPVTQPPAAPPQEAGGPATTSRRILLTVVGVPFLVALVVLATLGITKWWPSAGGVDARTAPSALNGTSAPPSASIARRPATPSPNAPTSPVIKGNDPIASALPSSSVPDLRSTPPSPTPTDPIVAMRLSIRRQVDAGNLNPTAAPDLYKKVDDISRATQDGKPGDAAKKAQDLQNKLTELHESGPLTTAGYLQLNAELDRLVNSLSLTEPPGPAKPTRR